VNNLDRLKTALDGADQEWVDALLDMTLLHDEKGDDYRDEIDEYANYVTAEDYGIAAWLGATLRKAEKDGRVKTFVKKGKLRNEGMDDAMLDLAVINTIILILWKRTQAGTLVDYNRELDAIAARVHVPDYCLTRVQYEEAVRPPVTLSREIRRITNGRFGYAVGEACTTGGMGPYCPYEEYVEHHKRLHEASEVELPCTKEEYCEAWKCALPREFFTDVLSITDYEHWIAVWSRSGRRYIGLAFSKAEESWDYFTKEYPKFIQEQREAEAA